MSLSKQEFTNAGRSMLGRAQNGETLTISKLVVGSGSVGAASEIWPLTALVTHELDVTLTGKRDYGDGTMLVEGSFLSSQAAHSFYLREVGVMAHIGAEADQLYSAANVITDPPDHIDPVLPTIQAFKIKLVIDRIPTDSLVVEIGATENITGINEGSDSDGPGVFHEAVANVLHFKRLKAGPAISITEDTAEHIITIGEKQLTANLDLFVPASHPQCPSPDVGFPTVQAAHDYLATFRIPSDKYATIHVWEGTFVSATPIKINHPDAQQISIYGEARRDKTITSIQYIDSTHKRLVIADISGLANGLIGYVVGADVPWCGGCKLTSAPAVNNVPVSIEKRDAQGNYTTTDNGAGRRFSYYPTVLQCTANNTIDNDVISLPNGIRMLKNICLVGGAWSCIDIRGNANLWGVQMYGQAEVGLRAQAGRILVFGEGAISNCDMAVYGPGSVGIYEGYVGDTCLFYVNGNGQGFVPIGNTYQLGALQTSFANSYIYLNRNGYGANVGTGSGINGGRFYMSYNDIAIQAVTNGAAMIRFRANSIYMNGVDLKALGSSYIEYERFGGTAPTCDPPANTVGNQNSYIYVLP